jgi:putative zinc finger/helix-turn-helix YgiT family protein
MCGALAIELSTEPVDMGAGDRVVMVQPIEPYEHCTVCGEDLITASEIDELMRQAIEIERREAGLLSSRDIREIRLDLALTQSRLEKLLGVSEKTVTRWECGTVKQSAMADNFLRLLAAHPELVDSHGVIAREGRGPYKKRAE